MATYRFTSSLRSDSLYSKGGRVPDYVRGKLRNTYGDYSIIMYFDGEYPSDSRHANLDDQSTANIAQMLMTGSFNQEKGYYYIKDKNNIKSHAVKKWPFWENCKERRWNAWVEATEEICKRYLKKGKPVYQGLLSLAQSMKSSLKDQIHKTHAPKLEDSTVKNKRRRGLSKKQAEHPLIETKRLLNSIQVMVVKTSSLADKEKYIYMEPYTRPYKKGRALSSYTSQPKPIDATRSKLSESDKDFLATRDIGQVAGDFFNDLLNHGLGFDDNEEEK